MIARRSLSLPVLNVRAYDNAQMVVQKFFLHKYMTTLLMSRANFSIFATGLCMVLIQEAAKKSFITYLGHLPVIIQLPIPTSIPSPVKAHASPPSFQPSSHPSIFGKAYLSRLGTRNDSRTWWVDTLINDVIILTDAVEFLIDGGQTKH